MVTGCVWRLAISGRQKRQLWPTNATIRSIAITKRLRGWRARRLRYNRDARLVLPPHTARRRQQILLRPSMMRSPNSGLKRTQMLRLSVSDRPTKPLSNWRTNRQKHVDNKQHRMLQGLRRFRDNRQPPETSL